jgi:hypothetical protein
MNMNRSSTSMVRFRERFDKTCRELNLAPARNPVDCLPFCKQFAKLFRNKFSVILPALPPDAAMLGQVERALANGKRKGHYET